MKKSGAQFNRFDICAAYRCYAVEYHNGQWSKEYALFSVFERLHYRPAIHEQSSRHLTMNGFCILMNLIRQRGANIRDRR